jgi:two-component system, chemotaxis family, chemotaxis protein CheY
MKKILLADDSPISRSLLKALLSSHFEVIESENGVDALNKAKAENIDLFLLDYNMPGINGINLTKSLRREEKYSTTPIIILTSEKREEKKEEGKNAGVSGWILKDASQTHLLEMINKML